MPTIIGIVLALTVAVAMRWIGFDRDRAFYPTVLIVVASYYVLFAAMSGSAETVLLESVVMTMFAAGAVAGFKTSAWIVAGGLAGHGVFDLLRGDLLHNTGIPSWWPAFCASYDVAAGAGLAWIIRHPRESRTGEPALVNP